MILNIIDKLTQAQDAIARIKIDMDRDLPEEARFLGVQNPETPDTDPILFRKALNDLLQGGRTELRRLSGQKSLLNPFVLFDRSTEILFDDLPVLKKFVVANKRSFFKENLLLRLFSGIHQREDSQKVNENPYPDRHDSPEGSPLRKFKFLREPDFFNILRKSEFFNK